MIHAGVMREHNEQARRVVESVATVAVLMLWQVADCGNFAAWNGFKSAGWISDGLKQQTKTNLARLARRWGVPLALRMTKDEAITAIMSGRWGWGLKAPMLDLGADPAGGAKRIGYPGLAEAFSSMGQHGRKVWLKAMRTGRKGSLELALATRLRTFNGAIRPDVEAVREALGESDIGHPNGLPSDFRQLADAGCFDEAPGVRAPTVRLSSYDYMTADQLKTHRLKVDENGSAVSRRHFNAVRVPLFNPTTGRLKTRRDGSLKLVRMELRVGYLHTTDAQRWSGRVKTGSSNRRAAAVLRRIIIDGGDHQTAPLLCWVAVLGSHADSVPTIAMPNPPSQAEVEAAVASINRGIVRNRLRGIMAPGEPIPTDSDFDPAGVV